MTRLADATPVGTGAQRVIRASPLPVGAAAMFGSAAMVVALIGSWIPSLWGDEAASVMSAERPIPSLFRMLTHVDAVHGTYYLALHEWIVLFGPSPFSVRFPSAIGAGLTVAAIVLIAARLSGTRVAIAAGVIACILPRITYMGEEARSYAFSAAIGSWLTLLLIELLRRRDVRLRWWAVYGVVFAFGTYLFLYTALFALVHLAILIRSHPGRRFAWMWLRMVCASALVTSPLVVFAYLERTQIAYLGNNPQVTFNSIFAALWFGNAWFAVIGWGLIVSAVIGALVMRRRRARNGIGRVVSPAGRSFNAPAVPSLTFVALAWLVIPSAVLILTQYAYADFTARYLTYCAPAAALLMAVGLAALTRQRVRMMVAGLAAIVAAAAPIYLAQRGPYAMNNSDWAELSATVGAHAHAGDAIVFDESARPSRRPQLALHTYPAGFAGLRDVALETPFTENRTWYDSDYTIDQAYDLGRFDGVSRVWLVEYATRAHVDTYGVDDLEDHGYHKTSVRYRTHSEAIYLFER